jgi:hypothetical protein
MSKIAKVVCALAGAAVNGAAAAISGGNPIVVALSGGATGLLSEEVGEIVREDEIVVKLFGEKGKEEQKKAFSALMKGTEKLSGIPKPLAERIVQALDLHEAANARIEAAVDLQGSALAEVLKPLSERAAEENKAKAEKVEKAVTQKALDIELAKFVMLQDQVEAYKARMA